MLRILIWILMLIGGGALGIWLDLRWFHALFVNPLFHLATLTAGIFLLRLVLREPLGLLFFPWAVALILGSPTFILAIAPLEMLFMLVMIKLVEEPEAIRKLGDAYREYQEQVPGFNLRPDCWRQILHD